MTSNTSKGRLKAPHRDNGMAIYKVFDVVKELCDGINIAFQHDYWLLKFEFKKFTGLSVTTTDDNGFDRANNLMQKTSGLKVVGVGFGRTGTYSLGLALNDLGFKTFHTYHLYKNLDLIKMWTNNVFLPAIESNEFSLGNPDFDLLTSQGFVGAVDFPIALYFEELHEKFPDCKFILTERENSDVWFKSWNNMAINIAQTTNIGSGIFERVNQMSLYLRWLFCFVNKDTNILSIPPGASIPDPDSKNAIRSYEEHNRRVREIIPSEKLLVFDVTQGWEPLCDFLDVRHCPTTSFPKTNSARMVKIQAISSVLIPLSIILVILVAVLACTCQKLTGKKVSPWIDQRWKTRKYFLIKNQSEGKAE